MRISTRLDRRRGTLMALHERLLAHYGPLHWWPGETPFEVCVGAILTQNTAWTNVEKAIVALKAAGLLTVRAMARIEESRLAPIIRPAGYFNVKARRLKAFLTRLEGDFALDLGRLFKLPPTALRRWLLDVPGIGRETADSIVLYAAGKAAFVVDAYTRRLLGRHGLLAPGLDYDAVQGFFTEVLEPDVRLYNELHAQIVNVGKDFCRTHPRCRICPLAFDLERVGGTPRSV